MAVITRSKGSFCFQARTTASAAIPAVMGRMISCSAMLRKPCSRSGLSLITLLRSSIAISSNEMSERATEPPGSLPIALRAATPSSGFLQATIVQRVYPQIGHSRASQSVGRAPESSGLRPFDCMLSRKAPKRLCPAGFCAVNTRFPSRVLMTTRSPAKAARFIRETSAITHLHLYACHIICLIINPRQYLFRIPLANHVNSLYIFCAICGF